MGDMRGPRHRARGHRGGLRAKPFIAYTILSTTDFGAGDEVIYPVPGFPIYESQITINGAVPVPLYLRESRASRSTRTNSNRRSRRRPSS